MAAEFYGCKRHYLGKATSLAVTNSRLGVGLEFGIVWIAKSAFGCQAIWRAKNHILLMNLWLRSETGAPRKSRLFPPSFFDKIGP